MPLKIIFAGTPEFAAAHLQALLQSEHQVIAVYTQPDRPAGRGKKLTASPVKELALAHKIPVYQPLNFKEKIAQDELHNLQADLMVVVAYGLILPKIILDAPRLGCINVHASLLPRWRGAAPIQRAIEAGDTEIGVTIMQMDVGLDTGDMLLKTQCTIDATDTGGSLHDKLIAIGTPALIQALGLIESNNIQPQKQPEVGITYASKLSKEEAALNWNLSAEELERKVRAFNPFPVAHTKLSGARDDDRFRIWQASVIAENSKHSPATIVRIESDGLYVACQHNLLRLEILQLAGKKPMSVADILRGHPELFRQGDQLEMPA
jgi:methionyl-tRNA formyltransferase